MPGKIFSSHEKDFAAMSFILSMTILSRYPSGFRKLVAVAAVAVTFYVIATVDSFLVNSLSANCGSKCGVPLCFFAGYLPASIFWQLVSWKSSTAAIKKVKVEEDSNDAPATANQGIDPARLHRRDFATKMGRVVRQFGLMIPCFLFVDRLTTPSFLFGVLMVEGRELIVPFANASLDILENPSTSFGATRRTRLFNKLKLLAQAFMPLNAGLGTIFVSLGMVIVSGFDGDDWYFRRDVWIEVVASIAVHCTFQLVSVLFLEGPQYVRVLKQLQRFTTVAPSSGAGCPKHGTRAQKPQTAQVEMN